MTTMERRPASAPLEVRRAGGEGATRAPKSATLEPKPVLGVIAAATTDERALARAPQRATATVVALATMAEDIIAYVLLREAR